MCIPRERSLRTMCSAACGQCALRRAENAPSYETDGADPRITYVQSGLQKKKHRGQNLKNNETDAHVLGLQDPCGTHRQEEKCSIWVRGEKSTP